MRGIAMRRIGVLMLAAGLMLGLSGGAFARKWPRTPRAQAQDYLTISDERGPGDLVLLVWLAPPLVDDAATRALLDQYVVLAVVHARLGADHQASFARVTGLQALDGTGHPLAGLDGAALPADLRGPLSPLEAEVTQDLGGLGRGVQWFIFKGGPVHACAQGGPLSVPLDGTTYTFAPPVPGCAG
jgi:hypothetical protein